jgi:uncharacterized protein DUF2190
MASYEESLTSISLDADASLATYGGVSNIPGTPYPVPGNQYRFVKLTGAHKVGLCTAATDAAIGVMQNKPQVTNQAATVAIEGVTLVVSGAAVTAGTAVGPDTAGRAIAAAANPVIGYAIDAATAAGQLIPVLLK